MTFWNGEKLKQQLPGLVSPFSEGQVDCAAYRLSIGDEIYVSPSDQTSNANERTARRLKDGEAFTIPSGQFAFLLTQEIVSVPADALAFISIRAGTKFRGLVNVSGFHVDPGYQGRLLFAVFNAGPVTIHLRQGDSCFLIWYADLNAISGEIKKGMQMSDLPVDRINAISGQLHSFEGLAKRITQLEREGSLYKVIAALVTGLCLTYLTGLLRDCKGTGAAPAIASAAPMLAQTSVSPSNAQLPPGAAVRGASAAIPGASTTSSSAVPPPPATTAP